MTPATADNLVPFDLYAHAYWQVPTKSSGYVPFRLRPAQQVLDAEYCQQMDGRGFVRLNVLKCRQPGGTTYARSRALYYVIWHPGTTALTLAHEQTLPQQWLLRCREMRDRTPEYALPAVEATKQAELRFANGSRYYIGSAQGGFPGVGDTVHFLHLSELGRWDKPPISVNPESVLAPLQPAIPSGADIRGSVVLRESTGVLRGDYWHGLWQAGKSADDEYANIFLPWFLVPEYRLDEFSSDVIDLSPYEQDLIKIAKGHGVDLGRAQIAWRRNSLRQTPWFGNLDLWAPEYPAIEEEAFATPGATVFTTAQRKTARATVRPPQWIGAIVPSDNPSRFQLVGMESGHLRLWDHDPRRGEKPTERRNYVIGADVQWGEKGVSDWDTVVVKDCETGEVCAVLRDQFESFGDYARVLAALGYYYSTAMLAPERNTRGEAIINILKGRMANDWRYPRVYRRRASETRVERKVGSEWGWETTEDSKTQLIGYAMELMERGAVDVADERICDEMDIFVRNEKGKCGAIEGKHDDLLMGWMIANYVTRYAGARGFDPLPQPLPIRKPVEEWTATDHRAAEHIARKDKEDREIERQEDESLALGGIDIKAR